MSRMNKSLVKHLFLEPNPQPQKHEILLQYLKLQNRIFPSKQNYISFLSTQNIDEQYELASTILHELCYFSNFPPAYNTFEDVLSIEKFKMEFLKKKNYTFIARDHFIHIVNLYILGIYLFFYNEKIYDSITTSNRYNRTDQQYDNSKLSCVKDFLSEWKYFCLYHDLGYVLEALSSKDMQDSLGDTLIKLESNYTFTRSFVYSQTLMQHSSFGAIEILAKLLVSKMILSYSIEKAETGVSSYLNRFLNYIKNRDIFTYNAESKEITPYCAHKITNILNGYYHLEKIRNNYALKMLLSVVRSTHIAVVGTEKESGRILFISCPEEKGRSFFLLDFSNNTEIQKLLRYPDMLLFDDYVPDSLELDYFIKEMDDDEDYFGSILGFNEKSDYFDVVYEYISAKYYSKFLAIGNENELFEFSFEIYQWLYKKIYFEILDTCPQLQHYLHYESTIDYGNLNRDIIKHLKNRYDKLAKEKCVEYIRESIEKVDPYSDAPDSIDGILNTILDHFINKIKELSTSDAFKVELHDKLESHYINSLSFDLKLLLLYFNVYYKLRDILKQKDNSQIFDFDYNVFSPKSVPEYYSEGIQAKINLAFKSYLTDCSIITTKYIENEYKIPYGNTQDHGIVSAKYAAGIFGLYRNAIIEAGKNIQSLSLLSVLLDITEHKIIEDKYITNYNHVIQEVVYAIFVHNLYPSEFQNVSLKKYKTKLTDPFTYFALLSDSLQQWNRPHSVLQSVFQFIPNNDASNEYNIHVQDGYIYVFEGNKETDQNRLSNNIIKLSEFLSDVDAVVKIGYTNTDRY